MGYDARCTLRLEGSSTRGTAWLEHKDLVFRGPVRLSIPLSEITKATAEGGVLRVCFGKRVAEFEIGASAAKWVARITNPPSRLDKLGVKPGMRVVADRVPDPVFLSELESRGASVVPLKGRSRQNVDLLFYRAEERGDLARLDALKQCIQPAGAIWVVRPKGSKAITESETMAAGKRAGLVDVKVVSFSEAYTAEKFVIPVAERPVPAKPKPRDSLPPRGRASENSARGVRKGPPT
jgi:hypothetical protein